MRVNLTRSFIEDPSLNVQVLLLIRDPRGTLQSRKHRTWCPGKPDCDQPDHLCKDLVSDYYAVQQLKKEFPNRIRVIRYEDFCKDIKNNAKELLQFFNFKMHPRVINFIESHTHENMGGVSSTFRGKFLSKTNRYWTGIIGISYMFITSDSKNAPYHWRNELNFTEVQNIQEKCRYLLTFSNSSSNSWFLHEHIFFFFSVKRWTYGVTEKLLHLKS